MPVPPHVEPQVSRKFEQVDVLSVAARAATNASMSDSRDVASPTIAHPPAVSAFVKAPMNLVAAFDRHADRPRQPS
jgi:hypothetical protein